MIAIKGMEMPRCCAECAFGDYAEWIERHFCSFYDDDYFIAEEDAKLERRSDCPLIEIAEPDIVLLEGMDENDEEPWR